MMMGNGTFIWNELATNHVEEARRFFADVLGWSYQEMDFGTGVYIVAVSGDDVVGGIVKMDELQLEGVPPHWAAYIKVQDVDETVDRVGRAGGRIVRAPFDVSTVGRIALIADPGGAIVGIMTPVEVD